MRRLSAHRALRQCLCQQLKAAADCVDSSITQAHLQHQQRIGGGLGHPPVTLAQETYAQEQAAQTPDEDAPAQTIQAMPTAEQEAPGTAALERGQEQANTVNEPAEAAREQADTVNEPADTASQQVQDAGERLGLDEASASAMAANYEGNTDLSVTEYAGEYMAVYNAAKEGASLEKATQGLGAHLDKAAQMAAHNAGSRAATQETQSAAPANNESGTVKYAKVTLPDGRQYVEEDRQVITGTDPKVWPKQVETHINDTIRQGRDVTVYAQDGTPLTITKDTAGKATFRNEVKRDDGSRRLMTDAEYAVKLRAEGHIDELAETSIGSGALTPDSKNHAFAKDGFQYRTAYYKDGAGYYRLTLSVGKNGAINTVYNVGKIKEANFPVQFGTTHRTDSGGSKAGEVASDQNVPQAQTAVNTLPDQDLTAPGLHRSYTREGMKRLGGKQAQQAARTQLRVLDAVAKKYGVSVQVVDSIAADKNAMYNTQTKQITVGLDAQEGAFMHVGFHELTHHIRNHSGQEWGMFRDFVVETLKARKVNVDALVAYQRETNKLSAEDALEEVVANSVPSILSDESTVQKLVQADRTLAQRCFDFLFDFLSNLRATAQRLAGTASWAQMSALQEDTDALRGISDRFFAALESAAEGQAQGVEIGGVQYSPKPRPGERYSYAALTAQRDMRVAQIADVEAYADGKTVRRADAIADGMQNVRAKNNPANTENRFFVDNSYTGRPVQITKPGLLHGMQGNAGRLNRNAAAVSVIGDLVQNAVPVNELLPREGATRTYLMVGMFQDQSLYYPVSLVINENNENLGVVVGLETLEGVNKQFLFAANAAEGIKKNQAPIRPEGYGVKADAPTGSEISIGEMLGIVKNRFAHGLSADTLNHFGMKRPEGAFSATAKFSAKDTMPSLAQIREIADEYAWDYDHIGIRTQDVPFELGTLDHASHVWENGKDTGVELSGVSVTSLDSEAAKMHTGEAAIGKGFYAGEHVALIGGTLDTYGEDAGEMILKNPEVLRVLTGGNAQSGTPAVKFSTKDLTPADVTDLVHENAAYKKSLALMQERVELLKAQMQTTDGRALRPGDVEALAGRLLRQVQSVRAPSHPPARHRLHRPLQPFRRLDLQHAAAAQAFRQAQLFRDVQFSLAQHQVAAAIRCVVDVHVAQAVRPREQEGLVGATRAGIVADVVGQRKVWAFQQEVDTLLLERMVGLAVFYAEQDAAAVHRAGTRLAEGRQHAQVVIPVRVKQVHAPVRQLEVNALRHVHVEHRRTQRTREGDGAQHGIGVGARHQWVEVRHVQILVQMEGDVAAVAREQRPHVRNVQRVGLVLRQVHVQLHKAQTQPRAGLQARLQPIVGQQGGHAEVHAITFHFFLSPRACHTKMHQRTPNLSTTSAMSGLNGQTPSGNITVPPSASAAYA